MAYNYGFPIDKWLLTMVFSIILQQVTWFKTCVCICHKNITVKTPPYDTICSTISYIQVLDILEWRTFTSRSRKSPVGQELWVFHLEVPTWFVHPSFHLSYSIYISVYQCLSPIHIIYDHVSYILLIQPMTRDVPLCSKYNWRSPQLLCRCTCATARATGTAVRAAVAAAP